MTSTAAVVRFDQTFYVLAFDKRFTARNVTKETASAHAVASFEFAGVASKSNPSCAAAFALATARVRSLMGDL